MSRRRDDAARVTALRELNLLDTAWEERFDRITRLASRLLGTDVALFNLVDASRQWTKSRHGIDLVEMPRHESVCTHVMEQDSMLVVEDLAADARFAGSPVVTERGLRFYAGAPVRDVNGHAVGALCVLDHAPRTLDAEQRGVLQALAGWVESELNARVIETAARAAALSEQRLRALLDAAPGAVLLLEDPAVVTWANGPAATIFGRPLGELLDRSLQEVLPSLDARDLQGQGRRERDAQAPSGRRLLERGERPDGSRFTAEVFVSRFPGSPPRYAVLVRDLDAEREDRRQLVQLQERTDVVFDALAEGVVVVEADGVLSYANLAAARLLASRRADVLERRWHDAVHARCPSPSCDLQDLFRHVGRRLSPVELHRGDGQSVPVELSVRLVRAGDDASALVVTLDDLTDRLAVDRMKNDFVSAVSHELRTPLTSIRGSLGLLQAGVVDTQSERGRRMLDIAVTSADRLSRLVNDLLDLERLQTQGVELQLAPHRAVHLMNAAAQAVSGAAAEADVRISVDEADATVLVDADRLVQVLVNLLGNAIKFSASGAEVRLSAEAGEGTVRLSVGDRGRGIPAEQLDRIFDRFAQVESGDRRRYGGTGLGLAIARTLVEQHGGRLTVTSAVGEGSTFTVHLPAAPDERRRLAYAPAEQVPPGIVDAVGTAWEVVAARPDDLTRNPPFDAVLVAADSPDQVAAVHEAARDAHLPLLLLASPSHGDGERPHPAPLDAPRDGGRRAVLLVEDDDQVAHILTTLLVQAGVEVDRVADEASAVTSAERRRPDLLLLDLVLAGGDGFGVVEQLRKDPRTRSLPVLVYSVLEPSGSERARLALGPTAFLTKSRHAAEDVREAVLGALARTEPRDEAEEQEGAGG